MKRREGTVAAPRCVKASATQRAASPRVATPRCGTPRVAARWCALSWVVAGVLSWPAGAGASSSDVFETLERLPERGRSFWATGDTSRAIVRVSSMRAALDAGLVPVTSRWAVARGGPDEWRAVLERNADFTLDWAPARAPLLDEAGRWVRAEGAVETGLSGAGVIVGVVDTGVDVTHPALRHADGTTRISWLLTFDEEPRGVHAALEQQYGCSLEAPCAVYSAADLNALLTDDTPGNEPNDSFGHGTHVTTTAAGRDTTYPGLAHDAELVIVQSGGRTGTFSDASILLGAKFVFDRAAEAQRPAVLNLSLGSSFGAHDGTSALEQGLAELAQGPGRALVVAAGNEGALYAPRETNPYPIPWGIHTEVNVPRGSRVRVPVLTPGQGEREREGSVFVWVAQESVGALSLGVEIEGGRSWALVKPGKTGGLTTADLGDDEGDYLIAVFNGTTESGGLGLSPSSAVIGIVGTWKEGKVFDVVLEGHGYTKLWLQSTGRWSPTYTGTGALFPGARSGGTVGIPASHADFVTVGSTVNRRTWSDYTGALIESDASEIGTLSYFSAAGPNRIGVAKPDVVAPGEYLVAGLSSGADPRDPDHLVSQFGSTSFCSDSDVPCWVVDDEHAVSVGTSMAAPIVTGLVALLLERDPELTLPRIKRLLWGGAQRVPGQTARGAWVGAGGLDVVGVLRAQDLAAAEVEILPRAASTRLSWADTFARPGGVLRGLVLLRDEEGAPAGGFAAERLSVRVEGGTGRVVRLAAGVAELELTARAPREGEELTVVVLFDDEELARETLPVGVDSATAYLGFEAFGSGCSWAGARRASGGALLLVAGVLYCARRRSSAQGSRAT